MGILGIIVLLLSVLTAAALWAATCFLCYRNDKVWRFRDRIIDLCHEYNRRRVMQIAAGFDVQDPYRRFLDKHTHNEMVFSLKPLRLEAWFTEDEIKELMS